MKPSSLAAGLLLISACGLAAAQGPAAPPATPSAAAQEDRPDYSPAERLLLMSRQLDTVKPPAKLSYRFIKSGSLEKPFTDAVTVKLTRDKTGKCCTAEGEFLTGERRINLPEVEQPEGNPVILYFLEHDIREMNRLTKGSTNYFRKRIRMALYNGASLRDTRVNYQGKSVAAKEITIRPFVDDPNRARFEQYTGKQYVFVLSDAVPGSVVAIRSTATPPAGGTPLIDEEMVLEGADSPRPAPTTTSQL